MPRAHNVEIDASYYQKEPGVGALVMFSVASSPMRLNRPGDGRYRRAKSKSTRGALLPEFYQIAHDHTASELRRYTSPYRSPDALAIFPGSHISSLVGIDRRVEIYSAISLLFCL